MLLSLLTVVADDTIRPSVHLPPARGKLRTLAAVSKDQQHRLEYVAKFDPLLPANHRDSLNVIFFAILPWRLVDTADPVFLYHIRYVYFKRRESRALVLISSQIDLCTFPIPAVLFA